MEVAKLTSWDPADLDRWGFSVAIERDVAIVGSPFDNGPGLGGSVGIFERGPGGRWAQVAEHFASDGGGLFGWSVSISGETAAVIAGTFGAVYVQERDHGGPGAWGEIAIPATGIGAGCTAIDGDLLIVGAPKYEQGPFPGAAFIFRRDQGGPDNWGVVTILTASDGSYDDLFGLSDSISGDTAVVGAPWDDLFEGAALRRQPRVELLDDDRPQRLTSARRSVAAARRQDRAGERVGRFCPGHPLGPSERVGRF